MPSAIQEKQAKTETRYSWWGWRRSRSSREATPALDTSDSLDKTKTAETKEEASSQSIKVDVAGTKLSMEEKTCSVY